MREIKFRGLVKDNNVWAYGAYVKAHSLKDYNIMNHFIITEDAEVEFSDVYGEIVTSNIPIKIETLGQYTGLEDRNGVEIYEGDILESNKTKFLVFYQLCSYRIRKLINNNKKTISYSLSNSLIISNYLVVGNIYENPELLEGKD